MINQAVFMAAPNVQFILASASPRRQAMLHALGLSFSSFDAGCAEPEIARNESGASFAMRAASHKCENAMLAQGKMGQKTIVIIAADTVVCQADIILGKPRNAGHALEMLRKLNGRRHEVHTAVSIHVRWPGRDLCKNFIVTTEVHFGKWPDQVLAAYAGSGEPADKAGAYAIQGNGAFLVQAIQGSWSNVVGLPLAQLVEFLLANSLIVVADNGINA